MTFKSTTSSPPPAPPLSSILPDIILGGAGFSNQLHHDPTQLPALEFVERAHALGLRALDTSPYYGDSEVILGDALRRSSIPREDWLLMTKAGRIAAEEFDYSEAWIRKSVARSLDRFDTSWLDVVFLHDAEYVPEEQVMEAVGALLELRREGKVIWVGVSGYKIPVLARLAKMARERFGRSLDVVQVWGQMTVQNSTLEHGLMKFGEAGVEVVLASSPLGVGLLREGGVPVGQLGDWHPAPQGLRETSAEVAEWVKTSGGSLAELALSFAVARAKSWREKECEVCVGTIIGAGNVEELEKNVRVCMDVLEKRRKGEVGYDEEMLEGVKKIFGEWIGYSLEG